MIKKNLNANASGTVTPGACMMLLINGFNPNCATAYGSDTYQLSSV
jgi:hypothetical protein